MIYIHDKVVLHSSAKLLTYGYTHQITDIYAQLWTAIAAFHLQHAKLMSMTIRYRTVININLVHSGIDKVRSFVLLWNHRGRRYKHVIILSKEIYECVAYPLCRP